SKRRARFMGPTSFAEPDRAISVQRREPEREGATMSDIVSSLSSQTGIGPDLVRKGLGAVLKMLQDQLPPELFSKVQGVVPDAVAMISASESTESEAGGMIQAVTSLAGKLFGN